MKQPPQVTPEMLADTADPSAGTVSDGPPRPASPPPERYGKFVLLRAIGEGGMGRVFAAYDEELDRRVALKLLRKTDLAGTEQKARILREAQAMARLEHPNVVHIYEVGDVDDALFIAMEFVENGTLAQWQRTGQREWVEILRLYRAAGHGLLSAHRAGLIHRDFKPENVLIAHDGRPKVADFGLACLRNAAEPLIATQVTSTKSPNTEPRESRPVLSQPLTMAGTLVGTPAYMSPEQFCAEPTDARSDQFSFCVSLYEALYGELPFDGNTVEALAANVIAGRIRPMPVREEIPAQVLRALQRGLAREPKQRFASMDELLAALDIDPQRDPAGVPQARQKFTFVYLVGIVGLILLQWKFYGMQEMPLREMLQSSVVLFFLMLAVAIGLRKTLLSNFFYRGMVLSILIMTGQDVVMRWLALQVGLSDRQAIPIDMVAHGGLTAMMAFGYLRTLWLCTALFVVGAFLGASYPLHASQIGLNVYLLDSLLFCFLLVRAARANKKGR